MSIASTKSPVKAYELGIYSSLACVVSTAVRLVQLFWGGLGPQWARQDYGASLALRLVEIVVLVSMTVAGFSIPRRPDVFHDGKLVDRAYTWSAWSRYNWSWPSAILLTAAKKDNLDLVDLPRPDHHTRAKETTEDWESRKLTGPLWISIISAVCDLNPSPPPPLHYQTCGHGNSRTLAPAFLVSLMPTLFPSLMVEEPDRTELLTARVA